MVYFIEKFKESCLRYKGYRRVRGNFIKEKFWERVVLYLLYKFWLSFWMIFELNVFEVVESRLNEDLCCNWL